jgi:hypothetical protein
MDAQDRLFIGIFPTGISYADRTVERCGDYKRLAFLSFATLRLVIETDCPKALKPAIVADAAAIQARKGEQFEVSSSGQTEWLGRLVP